MRVKFRKLHEDAKLPKYAMPGDAGLDFTAVEDPVVEIEEHSTYVEYRTGIAVEIPEGHVGLMFPRSSISRMALTLANSVGVIDSGYRGEITFRFRIDAMSIRDGSSYAYMRGERIGQLVIVPFPLIEPYFAKSLSTTKRGKGRFGSTGK